MRWLLRLLLGPADRRHIESDLAELYHVRRARDGERAAERWLRRQRLAYPFWLALDRLRAARGGLAAALAHVGRDAGYGVRGLVRAPAFTGTVILTVGLGLGATAAMLAVMRGVVVNSLPYADSDAIYWIYTDNPPFRFRFSVVDYRALEADHPAFAAVAAFQTTRVTVNQDDRAERVTSRSVTGSYFPLLGQRPAIGRLFDPSDDGRGERIVVLAHAYWSSRFGRDPHVLGRTIAFDDVPHTIVGVLENTAGPLERDIACFTPANWPPPRRKGPFSTTAIGRLRPGVSPATAAETLHATNARLFPIWKSSYQDEKATWNLVPLKDRVVGDAGATILLVLSAVACVLLIACVNTANLMVARVLARSRELAIRAALGASRARLAQQLLVETTLLTAGAALVGVAVAAGTLSLVRTYGASYIPRLDEVTFSAPVLAWLGACAAAGAVLIAIIPAVHARRVRIGAALASGGRTGSTGPAARRLRRALIAVEFALVTPLLVAAVLVVTSLARLGRTDVGLDPARLLTAELSLAGARYATEADRRAFWERALERLAALPGVEAAALSDARPPHEAFNTNNFNLEDKPTPEGENQPLCTWVAASPGFFRAAGLSLLRGRLLDRRDLSDGPPVVVVDRAWAARFFPGEEVVGRRLRGGGCTDCPWTTVVGVVGTVKYRGLEAPDEGTVYYPFVDPPNGFVLLRAPGDPASLTGSLREVVATLDPGIAVTSVATGGELVSDALTAPRYLSVVISMFAAAAIVLAIVGVSGVMAYFVQQHTREIGIRLALGGDPGAIRRSLLRQGVQMVAAGVAAGIGVAVAGARTIESLLFDISPTDPLVLAGVPLLLLVVAAAASLPSARRAARLDPVSVLRDV